MRNVEIRNYSNNNNNNNDNRKSSIREAHFTRFVEITAESKSQIDVVPRDLFRLLAETAAEVVFAGKWKPISARFCN